MIFDHLAGKSTHLQKRLIEEWLQNEANQERFYQWLFEKEQQSPQYLPEMDEKLSQFISYIETTPPTQTQSLEEEEETEMPKRRIWLRWMAAASIIFCLGLIGWLKQDSFLYKTYLTAYGETRSVALSDGSKVTLNANSSLSVPRFGFGNRTREVLLKGEAEFSVKHTIDNKRFIVKTDNLLDVVVLGTEFTVYARQRGAKVVLNKGKVQLRYQEGKATKELIMKPGDLVTLDQRNHLKQEVTEQPQKYAAWKEHRFVFEDTTLQEFTALLAENYGLHVTIENDTLAKRTLVGSFRADNAEELLTTVSEIFNIKVIKSGNNIILTDK